LSCRNVDKAADRQIAEVDPVADHFRKTPIMKTSKIKAAFLEPANRARELHQETTNMLALAAGVGRFPASLEQGDAQTIEETLADAYLDGAESSNDPGRLESLQKLAERAIARLAWLRALT